MRQRQTRLIVGWIVVWLLSSGCRPDTARSPQAEGPRRTLRVAAAADLTYVLPELIRRFRAEHPQVEVEIAFGSSGNLYAQVRQQAPFDLYLSADADYPRRLVAEGVVPGESLFPYAAGRLAVWVRRDSPLNLEQLGIRAILDPSVRKIAIANPRHAPYGRAAQTALENLGLAEDVAERLVLGDNVAQAAQMVASGGAEIGLISLSIAAAPARRETGRYCEVPAAAYPLLQQTGVVVPWGTNRADAESLRDFLGSPAAQTLLTTYGLQSPPLPQSKE